MASPDLSTTYNILCDCAAARSRLTYTELSEAYMKRSGDWHEPHGTWDEPLGELNRRVHAAGCPAISALVVLKATSQPGGRFWGSAPNVPPRPKNDMARLTTWQAILKAVHAFPWPATVPSGLQ